MRAVSTAKGGAPGSARAVVGEVDFEFPELSVSLFQSIFALKEFRGCM
jgi:hypothetical protein